VGLEGYAPEAVSVEESGIGADDPPPRLELPPDRLRQVRNGGVAPIQGGHRLPQRILRGELETGERVVEPAPSRLKVRLHDRGRSEPSGTAPDDAFDGRISNPAGWAGLGIVRTSDRRNAVLPVGRITEPEGEVDRPRIPHRL